MLKKVKGHNANTIEPLERKIPITAVCRYEDCDDPATTAVVFDDPYEPGDDEYESEVYLCDEHYKAAEAFNEYVADTSDLDKILEALSTSKEKDDLKS